MAENNKVLLILLTCLVVLSLVCSLGYGIALNNKIKAVSTPDLTPINDKLTLLASNDVALGSKIDALQSTAVNETPESFTLTKSEYEKQTTEDKALELATAFVGSKDFKKIAFETLTHGLSPNSHIEEYKDISNIEVLETDVSCSSDVCTVVFEKVKVYYEAADTEKATIRNFEVTVNNVVFDDDFEDAEVADYDTSLGIVNNGMNILGEYEIISTE
jgi:hypothetical protein